jgi:rhamnopyranosyl-N-acetylglucosaminyl-diphospho-decaprenol beta-1,3/1,4-galactofuranosyltransferase
MSVVAVVVTHNRRALLLECLEALAAQPVSEVVLVDNASTDGTLEHVEASGLPARVPIRAVRLRRNGGGAEGFHYGVREALALGCDWLWLMDDDSEPCPGSLDALLRSPHAAEADVLAPRVVDRRGRPLPVNSGRFRRRWLFAPLVPADGARLDYCSFVGPLIRAGAARRAGLPMREMFIRFDDLEYVSRLRGPIYLVAASRVLHKDPHPVAPGFAARLRDYLRPTPFAEQWKRLYGLRNLLYCGLRDGYFTLPRATSHVLVYAVRTLLLDERRLTTLRLLARYALDARRGRFLNVPPDRWPRLAEALDYSQDVAEPVRRLRAAASPPTAAG